MKYLKKLGLGGRILVTLVVAGSVFGIATAVQADIPDGNVINGCYAKPGTPQKGELRVRDLSQGEGCRFYENPISWNSAFPPGFGDVYYGSGEVLNTSGGGTVASVTVPPGNYHVVATGWAAGLTAGLKDIRCYINQINSDADDVFLSVGLDTVDIGGQESFAVQQDDARPGGGTLTINCLDSSTDGTILEGAQITATEVNNLNGTVFGPTQKANVKGGATPSHH